MTSCYQILRVDEGVVGSSLTPPAGSWTWNEPPWSKMRFRFVINSEWADIRLLLNFSPSSHPPFFPFFPSSHCFHFNSPPFKLPSLPPPLLSSFVMLHVAFKRGALLLLLLHFCKPVKAPNSVRASWTWNIMRRREDARSRGWGGGGGSQSAIQPRAHARDSRCPSPRWRKKKLICIANELLGASSPSILGGKKKKLLIWRRVFIPARFSATQRNHKKYHKKHQINED